ncbi:MAG: hypothetical protein CL910_20575 [Deltaproteobacteria bacterium]|jgi:subtilisin family serine protease|nr:hypothetical protein [Deltaproteobacteria bacterium]
MGIRRSVVAALAGLALVLGSGALAGPDPYARSSGSWGQPGPDQWALLDMGWKPAAGGEPVLVAILDSGIDWLHPDLPADRVWRNPKERFNGLDDDGNGYVDDRIGWDFVAGRPDPWDDVGHGTHVAGLIAARTDNDLGIAGLSASARILPLKVLGASGRGRASHVVAALDYATAQGARVINLSLGGEALTALEKAGIERATAAGAVVVVAAGNGSRPTGLLGVGQVPGVIVVAATGRNRVRAPFSNFGSDVGLAAPGVDILSLRARGSDLIRVSGAAGPAGAAVVGAEGAYLRASGTSFSAALVSGVAARMLAARSSLTPVQVVRMLRQSARDVAPAGVDQLTGYGRLDAAAALAADPDRYVEAVLARIELAPGRQVLRIVGTADADAFASATLTATPILESARDEDEEDRPGRIEVKIDAPVTSGILTRLDRGALADAAEWKVELEVRHQDGRTRRAGMIFAAREAEKEDTRGPREAVPLAVAPALPGGAAALLLLPRAQVGGEHVDSIDLSRALQTGGSSHQMARSPSGGDAKGFARSHGLASEQGHELRDGSLLASVPDGACPAGAECSEDPCRTYQQQEGAAVHAGAGSRLALRGKLEKTGGSAAANAPLRLVPAAPRLGAFLGESGSELAAGAVSPGALECAPTGYDAPFSDVGRSDSAGLFSLTAAGPNTADRGCWDVVSDAECDPQRAPLRDLAPELEPGRISVLVPSGSAGIGAALAGLAGLTLLDADPLASIDRTLLRFSVPAGGTTVALALAALQGDDRVDLAQQERRYHTVGAYADPLGAYNYGPGLIGAERLHPAATGKGVTVAIVDSGVDAKHPELAGRVIGSHDTTGYGTSADRHGTAVAGLIAAQPDNGTGAWGAAPGANILSIKACQPASPGELDARCWSATVAKAIDLAVEKNAKIVNLSIAGPEDPLVERVVAAALTRGVMVVAATGNGGPNAQPSYPAALDAVLAVTAVDSDDRLYHHATRGTFVDVAAPGVEVISPAPDQGYPALSGTSFASAFVSGAAALLFELDATASADAVRSALQSTSADLGDPGPDPLYGSGRIDLCAAAAEIKGGQSVCP